MAATIKSTFNVEPKLIGGGGGIFDVRADGRMIFSKHEAGRFPEEDEVIQALRTPAER